MAAYEMCFVCVCNMCFVRVCSVCNSHVTLEGWSQCIPKMGEAPLDPEVGMVRDYSMASGEGNVVMVPFG